jgi:hypothetical protein
VHDGTGQAETHASFLLMDGASSAAAFWLEIILICCLAAQFIGPRLSRCELYSAAIGELDITPDEWSACLKDIFRANRKAQRRASGTAHR